MKAPDQWDDSRLLEPLPYTAKWWKNEGVLGSIFTTQLALKIRVREIVNHADLNAPVVKSDAAFLIDVLRRHHHWKEKQGSGILSVVVRLNPPPGFGSAKRGLWLIRKDGSEVDISWYTPLERGGALYAARGVAWAARCEVADQTRAVYEMSRGTPCPVCGKPLQQGHVDHIAPLTFDRLLSDWLVIEALAIDEVEVADRGIETFFADRALAARWAHFHRTNAKLRLIHPGENLSLPK